MKIRQKTVAKIVFWAFIILFFGGACFADEIILDETDDLVQDILNEKSGASVQLNSQITEKGKAKKQGIHNIKSWCNVSINRNTYKFYYINTADK